jgi:hypothetical protein
MTTVEEVRGGAESYKLPVDYNKQLKECQEKRRTNKVEMGTLIAIIIIFLILTGIAASYQRWALAWILTITMIAAFIAVLGLYTVCRPLGILVNERNLISLARFQVILWTVLFVSAYFVIVIVNISVKIADPFNIIIDPTLWALLGISVTSLVGAPLIDGNKSAKKPDNEGKAASVAVAAYGEKQNEVIANSRGILYGNPDPHWARFTDMFEGNELINVAYIDVTKLQLFFFTVIAVVIYAWFLMNQFLNVNGAITAFPPLTEGYIALLGISHAGYLGGKSITQTKTGVGG